jgi:tetratricopeptide (TPR) repeat protein
VSGLVRTCCLLSLSLSIASVVHGESILDLRERARQAYLAGDWKTAADAYGELVERSPDDGTVWRALGFSRLQLERYDDAIDAYEQCIRTGASIPTCRYDIACANALAGRSKQALDALAEAFASGFCNEELIDGDHDLASLRNESRFRRIVGRPERGVDDRRERWERDFAHLARRVREVHWNPFRILPEADFDAGLADIAASIDEFDDVQMRLRVQRLLASLGDGHTAVASDFFAMHHGASSGDARFLPIETFWYDDGVRIIAATPEHANWIGARVKRIGGMDVETVLAKAGPYVSRDNEWGARWGLMQFLTDPKSLHGLGLGRVDDGFEFEVETLDGRSSTTHLRAGGASEMQRTPLYEALGVPPTPFEREKAQHLWMEPFGSALYVRIDGVRDGHESFADFTDRIFRTADENDSQALIVDLRDNLGGQGHLWQPLLHRVMASRFNELGRLYVLVGRKTFSAAMALAAQLDLHAAARFVGEPTGSRPNFVGETSLVRLPYAALSPSISSRNNQNGSTNDTRLWIAPHVPATPSFEMARQGRDPALEAVAALLAQRDTR